MNYFYSKILSNFLGSLQKLKHELEMEKKLDAERQRSHELTCELKFHRQLIHLLYPDLDRKLGECSGGENQNES